jgi:hypothetical protein
MLRFVDDDGYQLMRIALATFYRSPQINGVVNTFDELPAYSNVFLKPVTWQSRLAKSHASFKTKVEHWIVPQNMLPR